jgi:hypothetical protein
MGEGGAPEEAEVLDGAGVAHVLALVKEARRVVPRVVLAYLKRLKTNITKCNFGVFRVWYRRIWNWVRECRCESSPCRSPSCSERISSVRSLHTQSRTTCSHATQCSLPLFSARGRKQKDKAVGQIKIQNHIPRT